MALNKRDRNRIYEAIAEGAVDPAEFDLEETGNKVVITHSSGSTFEFYRRTYQNIDEVKANIVDGDNWNILVAIVTGNLEANIRRWVNEIQRTAGVPDYWEEMKHSQESIAVIRREDFENTPFTQDEQRQISAQLQQAKKQLAQFALSSEQMSQVEERLDELAEASHHLGRKDWLIIFITTISPLVVGDVLTPGVARHIFTMIINGLIHLFGGGPPQILS